MNIYHIYIHTYTYQEDHVYIQCLWFMSMVYVTVTHNAGKIPRMIMTSLWFMHLVMAAIRIHVQCMCDMPLLQYCQLPG